MSNSSMLASNIYQQQEIPMMEPRLLINNQMYHTYLPSMSLVLSLFYMTYLFIRAIQTHFKRNKTRRKTKEKLYLRKRWEQKMSLPNISYPQQTHKTSNSSVTFVQKSNHSILSNSTVIIEEKQQQQTGYFLKINERKRLDLLWQWSVSMGYCQYEYGKNLDHLIKELQEKQNNLCIIEKN